MFARLLIFLFVSLLSLDAGAARLPTYQLAVLRDTAGTLSIDDIASTDPARFKTLPRGNFSAGFTRSTHWLRLTVEAPPGEWWLDILPAVLDDIRLFEPDPAGAGAWIERRAGDTLPFSAREVPFRGFVFKLQHSDDTPRTYYLRLQTSSVSMLTPRLLSPHDFIRTATLESSLLSAVVASVLIVVLLNLNNWLWLRDRLSPWVMAQLLSFAGGFFWVSGFPQQYLFPDSTELHSRAISILSLLLIGTGNGMYRRLFGIDRQRPFLFWFYELSCWLPMAAIPVALLGWHTDILPVFLYLTIFTTTVGCIVSVAMWRRRATGTGALLVANFLSFAGILASLAQILGLLSGGVLAWQSLQLTSLGCMLALHVSLGAHYRNLGQARQQAELQARWEREERIRQQQFLAMLTHELRTSLSVLRMAVGIQPMSSKSLAKAERAMSSMGEVIEQSIQADKLADGKVGLERLPCDVSALVQAVIADSREPDRVNADLSHGVLCETDGRLLRIIIVNLIDNALKYGKSGAPVDVALITEGGRLCLRVSNEIGSAGAPDPDRVFEKYYRAPKAHRITGSGLGLHIAAALAQMLDGTLRYLPAPGRVCFEARL
ncbi:sensor histidine kinase [Rhodocyclus purpureus]|uniref:sensor histidine kinase n=1 Tax=Rhodocyclus purpureus TaxID=1067 RepID=UPI0019149A49|nr:7TM-DISM domain-containing protein [Rhodocyclus purpureus]MBK5914431.1 hypothetical protein [Rhodocyclus purpureus]